MDGIRGELTEDFDWKRVDVQNSKVQTFKFSLTRFCLPGYANGCCFEVGDIRHTFMSRFMKAR